MTALTPEKLAELQRLLDVVRDGSPLPWRRIGSRVDSANRFKVAECLLDEDAALIAAAVNTLPALLDAAAERDALAAKVERVRALPVGPPSGGFYMISMREVRQALDGKETDHA